MNEISLLREENAHKYENFDIFIYTISALYYTEYFILYIPFNYVYSTYLGISTKFIFTQQ